MDSNYIELNNGMKIPRVGLGTLKIENIENVVYESIKKGLRLIDGASFYENEKEVGAGINKAINEKIVERKDLFVVTKLNKVRRDQPEEQLKIQLADLNLEYVDLYLDHWPVAEIEDNGRVVIAPNHVVWKKLEGLVRNGFTKSIGVSNYNVQSLMNLLSYCEIKPVINQVECHPYFNNSALISYCHTNGINVMVFNSMCKGVYVKKNIKHEVKLLEENVIIEMSQIYQKTPGQIAVNWALSRNLIAIPASSKEDRVAENLAAAEFTMKDEDLKKISLLNVDMRCCRSSWLGSDIFA